MTEQTPVDESSKEVPVEDESHVTSEPSLITPTDLVAEMDMTEDRPDVEDEEPEPTQEEVPTPQTVLDDMLDAAPEENMPAIEPQAELIMDVPSMTNYITPPVAEAPVSEPSSVSATSDPTLLLDPMRLAQDTPQVSEIQAPTPIRSELSVSAMDILAQENSSMNFNMTEGPRKKKKKKKRKQAPIKVETNQSLMSELPSVHELEQWELAIREMSLQVKKEGQEKIQSLSLKVEQLEAKLKK